MVNEPQARFVPLEILKDYYRQAYKIVRKYSANTYVVISELLWDDPNNLVDLGKEFENAIIDLHYYNAFGSTFANMNIQQNIDFIYKERMQEIVSEWSMKLEALINSNGLLSFVGMCDNKLITCITGACLNKNQCPYEFSHPTTSIHSWIHKGRL